MDFDYRLPDTEAPVITIRRTALGGLRVLVDGTPIRGRGGVYEIAGPDGEAHLVKVTGAWTGLRAIADGWDTALEPATPVWSMALVFLPLILVAGGLIGATLGAVGVALNAVIGRSALRVPLRALAMVLVTVLGAVAWLGAGAALTSIASAGVSYATGTCLDGITPTTDLVAQAPRSVDCGSAHDAEVVGTFSLDALAAYPGSSGLVASASQRCPALFAAYDGVGFSASSLDILPVVPTQVAWEAGAREVACVALTTDGSKLTGSIKGAGR